MKFVIFFVLFLFSINIFAMGDIKKGHELAKRSELANEGFIGEVANMKMLITSARGETIEREMRGTTYEIKGKTQKKLLEFKKPLDIRGTKLLTWTHKKEDDDQWLFLPSLKRVKRISSSSKSASFMGSEFSYEDLGSQSVEKYDYFYLKDGTIDGNAVWVMDSIPKVKSGYSKQRVYMSQKYLIALKVEYFNRRNEHFKTATFKKIKKFKVAGKTMYRAQSAKMENLQTKKSSEFLWLDLQLGGKLKEKSFHKRELKR